MFKDINGRYDARQLVQQPASCSDPNELQNAAKPVRSSHSDAIPRPSRKIRAQTEGIFTSPNGKVDKKLRKERKARKSFEAGSKEKLPELPEKFKPKRDRSVVDSEEHSMANNLATTEHQRRRANDALFAERFHSLLDSDDGSIPASSPKRPRTKSPNGKGRAGPATERAVENTASKEEDDEDEDPDEQDIDHILSEEGDSVENGAGETIVGSVRRAAASEKRTTSPDLGSEDDAVVASTVDTNVPVSKSKKQKRKRTAEPDDESALPDSSTPEASSAELEEVQSQPKKQKQRKGKSIDAAPTGAGEASGDMPTAETSTSLASADQLQSSAKNKKDKRTSSAAVADNTIADAGQASHEAPGSGLLRALSQAEQNLLNGMKKRAQTDPLSQPKVCLIQCTAFPKTQRTDAPALSS